MTWQDKIDFDRCDQFDLGALASASESRPSRMTPGLTNTYDNELREKAGMHSPPPPPERMGLEGEYDDYGLVRRVAHALEQDPQLAAVDTVTLAQYGSTVALAGRVGDRVLLERIVTIARAVDGTRAVDSDQVAVANGAE
ncbi:BON domain-containing protein [Nodosilinea sp. PGN35]|uniref:phospholipid-binding protein n=1 Tax=Nodosilinea sp. PGN35 TaxID=3020489 RepID=UPI0023B34529|nr:phospholipid-binding protein [Nodosilinea sp. TSF1-S3]MDF0367286.1 hypothetical protein [Nodosilinea sp. TSF1-S3]